MLHSIKNAIIITILAAISIFLIFFTSWLGAQRISAVTIGAMTIPTLSLQGVMQYMSFLFCMLMVLVESQNIFVRALPLTIVLASTVVNILRIMRTGQLSSVPGLSAALTTFCAIIIQMKFIRRESANSKTDYVTGLKNRRIFDETLRESCKKGKRASLAYFELENFKRINDEFGILAGDIVLKRVSERMKKFVGNEISLFKMNGANFAMIFPGSISRKELSSTLNEIIDEAAKKIDVFNGEVSENSFEQSCEVSLVCGVSKFPDDASDSVELLRDAANAISYAKKTNAHVIFYNKTMEDEMTNQLEAEKLIKNALKNNWFYLVYQPQFETNTKRLRGFETLIRCRKPDGTSVSPGIFIPPAEKSNLIILIDHYVLRRGMMEFKPVLDKSKKKFILSLNVSAKNIASSDFADRVKALIEETGFPPKCLEIEITEYSFSDSLETTVRNIQMLKNIGVQIALDDFGTGYTSISQLLKLPINLLKIDKSLIDNIETSQMNRDLVDSVIYMGHVMNCEVISEGVENERQLSLLNAHKCDFIQGFVWGRPLEYKKAVELCMKPQ